MELLVCLDLVRGGACMKDVGSLSTTSRDMCAYADVVSVKHQVQLNAYLSPEIKLQ